MHAERMKMDKERMELETRRVSTLERLVELMEKKTVKFKHVIDTNVKWNW